MHVFNIFTIESECPNAWQKGLSCFVTSLTWCSLAGSWILGELLGHSYWMMTQVESCSSRTRETWNAVTLWWFKLGRSEQGCGRSCWIPAQQESPKSEREGSFWGSWLAARTGVDGFVGFRVHLFWEWWNSSEIPKPALTRADPGNGTNPCPAKSAWQGFTGSSGVNQGLEEILKEDLGSAQLQNSWSECWEADRTHC